MLARISLEGEPFGQALWLTQRGRVWCPLSQALIEKVTENNESPAPGWALDQMARLTMQKPGIEMEMVELLYKRLQKNACDVKLKTLRAMHFISRRGSVAFRRAMQRGSQLIRQHLSTTPPPQESCRRRPTLGSAGLRRSSVCVAHGSLLTNRGVYCCAQPSRATRTQCTATPRGA